MCALLILPPLALAADGGTDAAPPAAYHGGPRSSCTDCHGRGGDPGARCLSCHDGVRGVPDVVGDDINGLRERSAGFFLDAGYENPRGHDLGNGLTCTACHDPHGNGQARNLRLPSAGEAGPRLGLFLRPGMTGMSRYEKSNVAYGTLDSPELTELSALCLDCHEDFRAGARPQTGPGGAHLVHPSYDSRDGAPNRISQGGGRHTTDPGHWNRGEGSDFVIVSRVPFVTRGAGDYEAAARVDAGQNGVFCLSCHKAHGSEHRFALRWERQGPSGKAGCNQCHAVGPRREQEQWTQWVPPDR